MGKKRKYDSSLSEGGAEEPAAPPPAKAPRTDNLDGEENEYVVWLVVKPESVSTAELSKVAFPRKANGGAPVVVETSAAAAKEPQHIECRFNRPTSRMFYVKWNDSSKELKHLRPNAKVRGVVQISRCTRIDGDFVVPDDDLFI